MDSQETARGGGQRGGCISSPSSDWLLLPGRAGGCCIFPRGKGDHEEPAGPGAVQQFCRC